MQRKNYLILALALVAFSFSATAQDADFSPVVPATATPTDEVETTDKEEEDEDGLSISGFVDGYYQWTSIGTGFETSFTEQVDAFALGMANVVFAKEAGKVGFVADLAFGPRAEVANGEFGTITAIKQLYMTYSPSDAVTLTFGNFSTFVGYELIDAPGNVNYSTSYLFSNGPFYHTGLKADFALSDNFGAMIGIFNDTDSKFDEIAGKHIGAQLSAEAGGLSAYLNFLYGVEDEIEGRDEDLTEMEIDLTATYTVSDNLMLGLNVANYGTSLDGDSFGGFFGSALYATITTSDAFALGLRGELFTPTDGDDTTDDTSIIALTASGNIMIGDLRIIPEVRFDSASMPYYLSDEDMFEESMLGFILATVYTF